MIKKNLKRAYSLILFNQLANRLESVFKEYLKLKNEQNTAKCYEKLDLLKNKYHRFLTFRHQYIENNSHKEYQILPYLYDWITLFEYYLDFLENPESISEVVPVIEYSENTTLPGYASAWLNIMTTSRQSLQTNKDLHQIENWELNANQLIELLPETKFTIQYKNFFISLFNYEKAYWYYSIGLTDITKSIIQDLHESQTTEKQTDPYHIKNRTKYEWHYNKVFGEKFMDFVIKIIPAPVIK